MPDMAEKTILDAINSHRVLLFMKGSPDTPRCGFSALVVNILDLLEVPFASVDVLADPTIRAGIKVFSDWPTVPQLYVDAEFLGGCDIIKAMYQSGELQKTLEEKGLLQTNKPAGPQMEKPQA